MSQHKGINEFKKELHSLLKKYNASITCQIEGDTHCLGFEMVVDFGQADKWREYTLTTENYIDWNDVK